MGSLKSDHFATHQTLLLLRQSSQLTEVVCLSFKKILFIYKSMRLPGTSKNFPWNSAVCITLYFNAVRRSLAPKQPKKKWASLFKKFALRSFYSAVYRLCRPDCRGLTFFSMSLGLKIAALFWARFVTLCGSVRRPGIVDTRMWINLSLSIKFLLFVLLFDQFNELRKTGFWFEFLNHFGLSQTDYSSIYFSLTNLLISLLLVPHSTDQTNNQNQNQLKKTTRQGMTGHPIANCRLCGLSD